MCLPPEVSAVPHAHLVSLTLTLLDVLRGRLLRYGVVKNLPSLEGIVEWVRRSARHPFAHAETLLAISAVTIYNNITIIQNGSTCSEINRYYGIQSSCGPCA